VLDVACAADRAYTPHAAAMLRSVLVTGRPDRIRLHFLHPPHFPGPVRHRLETMVSALGGTIVFHEIGAELSRELLPKERESEVNWYRLALPSLLPDVERLLYLDTDTLVLKPVAPLWELDLAGCPVAAVTNVFPPRLVHRPDDLGIPRDRYFNSGVLLMDLAAWRAGGISERVLAVSRAEPDHVRFHDQDPLNMTLHDSWFPLHPRWNCQNSILLFRTGEELLGVVPTAEARAHPAILHFEGPAWAKPWHYLSTHPQRPMYFEHRAHTPWPKVELEERTLENRLRRHLPEPAMETIRWARGKLR
jgi:lipopolysaccharide biosynthesis glycosyltransferase